MLFLGRRFLNGLILKFENVSPATKYFTEGWGRLRKTLTGYERVRLHDTKVRARGYHNRH